MFNFFRYEVVYPLLAFPTPAVSMSGSKADHKCCQSQQT